jgi:hypothetical protein
LAAGVFVGRPKLRSFVKNLLRRTDVPRVIMVYGPSDSGKTYSKFLVHHVQNQTPYLKAFSFEAKPPATYTPEKLATEILRKLKPPNGVPLPPAEDKPAHYAEDLANLILAQIPAGPLWLVFDGFSDAAVPQATRLLLAKLANEAYANAANLRIVLLGCQKGEIALVNAFSEVIAPPSAQDLQDFFSAVWKAYGRPISAAEISAAVQQVMDADDQSDARFVKMYERAHEIVNNLTI